MFDSTSKDTWNNDRNQSKVIDTRVSVGGSSEKKAATYPSCLLTTIWRNKLELFALG